MSDPDPIQSTSSARSAVEGPSRRPDRGRAGDSGDGRETIIGRLAQLAATPEARVFGFLIVLCVILAIAEPLFLTKINLQNIGRQTAVLMVLSVGLLFVLLVGGIDLSVAGSMGLAAVIAAKVANSTSSPIEGFVVAVALCTAIGAINGLLIGLARLSPIVVTVAVGQVLLGVGLLLTTNGAIVVHNPAYPKLATDMFGPVPLIFLVALGCAVLAYGVLKRVRLGRYIYAVGGNEMAAWLAGVPVWRTKVTGYTFAGFFAGLAGILASSRVGNGDPSVGNAVMISAYAAVFIGGVGFGTGKGNVSGVIFGALTLGVISNGIDLQRLNTDWQYIVGGVLIVVAIGFQALPLLRRDRA
jgi:ribose/xylose/arabinose/galactoside ABC-type transport system permease subunit